MDSFNVTDSSGITTNNTPSVEQLQKDAQTLRAEIAELRGTKAKLLEQQLSATQTALERFANDHLKTLEERKQTLQIAVDQLERRQERVQAEMRQSFAGVSQDLAIRIHGFHDYLVTSLQDLVIAAEKLELAPKEAPKPQVPSPQTPPAPRPEVVSEQRQRSAPPQHDRVPLNSALRRLSSLALNLPLRNLRKKPDKFARFSINTALIPITMVLPGNCVAPLSQFMPSGWPAGFLPLGVEGHCGPSAVVFKISWWLQPRFRSCGNYMATMFVL